MATVMDGKALSAALRSQIAYDAASLVEYGVTPGLAVVLVGTDPASQIYVRAKVRQTMEAGMSSFEHRLPSDITEEKLIALIDELNRNDLIDGILVQLPLPGHIDSDRVCRAVDPAKDVDGFHPTNVGLVAMGGGGVVPCTPSGVMLLIRSIREDLTGLHAVIVGRSNIVGKPMAQLLLRENCTVTVAHSRSQNLSEITREADILIAAAGRPELIRGDWVKEGAIVVDVGINRLAEDGGRVGLVGDVAYDEVAARAAAITPVPGGVGPMTIACLLQNTLTAARSRRG